MSLSDLARAKWRSSGLTDEHAAALRLEVLEKEAVSVLGPNFAPAGGIRIPYFDAKGQPTEFFRFRYLEPLPGFQLKKPRRYVQPIGTINEVYMPPLLDRQWAEIQRDPKIPLCITEGEFKAACGCANALPTLGLGGVDVWRSSKRHLDLLPALADFAWKGRFVTIVYDSDAATNPDVVRAQRQLAKELTALGAIPHIASLPPTPEGKKQGLDDFIVAKGVAEFLEIIKNAQEFEEAAALWEMNEEVVYVRDPGLIIIRETKQKISPTAFVQHTYANRHYTEYSQTKNGTKAEKKFTARRWMEWERRFELDRITYRPGQPGMVDNQWNQWPGWGVVPEPGNVEPWHQLLQFIFKTNDEARQWFERWCAYPLQYPGIKMFSSAVIWGVIHGTGKTLIAYTLKRIYGENFAEIKNKHLKGGFNEWACNKQFVYGDEITGNDGKRADADLIKGLITQEELRINEKYVPSFVIPDCVNYYFSSNHSDALFLEDSDRRFFVHEVVGQPAGLDFYRMYDGWLRNGGASALFYHLLRLDLGDFDPRAPALATRSKEAMIRDNKSDVGTWVLTLKEDPCAALSRLDEKKAKECDLYTPSMLHQAYDPDRCTNVTTNGMSRELKRAGFRQVNHGIPVKTVMSLQRLYAVRNQDKWDRASPRECAEHFNRFFGPDGGKF